jgi:hypothetical protein
MTTRCNEHGVYEADETLVLPRQAKNWRGAPIAEISLVDLGGHWIWAVAYQLHSGNWEGSSSPLMDTDPTPFSNYRAPTRKAAIDAAVAQLRKRLTKLADEGSADAAAVIAWLPTLNPAQMDLFGSAA